MEGSGKLRRAQPKLKIIYWSPEVSDTGIKNGGTTLLVATILLGFCHSVTQNRG